MAKVVCECGHENPHGTILCESCGKPLQEEKTKEILTMRYEGSARRSQTYKRTPIDKLWNFFSSVKIGVTLIVLVLIAASLGTILPQEIYIPPNADPAQYYAEEYGGLGQLYYQLGFNDLYSSWWFILLVALLGLSTIIASIDRGIPLYRAFKNQRVSRHDIFLERQRVFSKSKVDHPDEIMRNAKDVLKGKRYKIREEDGNLFAEKWRFARWGPYVNHAGLIIFMIGVMLRVFPGMYVDENLWVREGEIEKIPGTNGEYYIENHEFSVETYDEKDERYAEALRKHSEGPMVKEFRTDATLYRTVGEKALGADPELEKVKSAGIKVNHPLEFGDFGLYQVDFQSEFSKMSFQLEKKSSGESFGSFTVDLNDPKDMYDLGDGYKVEMLEYFPDFYFNEDDEPATKTGYPYNPAFIFKMVTPETPKGEVSFVGIRKNLEIYGENDYKLNFADVDTTQLTGLTVRKDRTLPVLIVGGIVFMIGVVQGLYWQHRRIWLKRKDGEVWFAGSTNKNWYGLKNDMAAVTEVSGLSEPVDKLDSKNGKE